MESTVLFKQDQFQLPDDLFRIAKLIRTKILDLYKFCLYEGLHATQNCKIVQHLFESIVLIKIYYNIFYRHIRRYVQPMCK